MIAGIVAMATLAFLFWGGPLWRAAPGTSHVARIAGSYLIVIPLVLAALLVARRASWMHLLSGVGIVWAAKLVITATAYAYLAPGSGTRYAPDRPWEARSAEPDDPRLKVAAPTQGSGEVAGVVLDQGEPVMGAAIVLDDQEGTRAAPSAVDVVLVIDHSHYSQPIYRVSSVDRLVVGNRDALLHTLRVTKEGRAVANIPIPAGSSERRVSIPEAGVYELSCENHPEEQAWLVVDRPYVAQTDAQGRFELHGVPAGSHRMVIMRGRVSARREFNLTADERVDLSIELKEGTRAP